MMFPSIITNHNKNYYPLSDIPLSESKLKDLFLKYPYAIYAVVNEVIDEKIEPMLTTFLLLHTIEFENKVILYDISRQRHSTVTTELCFLVKGYIEVIDVGIVDRYPVQIYIREEV
jgi:hypothetical protein